MALFLVAVVLVVVVGAYFVLRARQSPAPATKNKSTATTRFPAVSIRIDRNSACAAARDRAGRRVLSIDAPRLPLPGCTARTCRCRFDHHPDRRAGARRASETGTFEPLFNGDNRREQPRGRRREDRGIAAARAEPDAFDTSSSYYDFISESGRYKKLDEDQSEL